MDYQEVIINIIHGRNDVAVLKKKNVAVQKKNHNANIQRPFLQYAYKHFTWASHILYIYIHINIHVYIYINNNTNNNNKSCLFIFLVW